MNHARECPGMTDFVSFFSLTGRITPKRNEQDTQMVRNLNVPIRVPIHREDTNYCTVCPLECQALFLVATMLSSECRKKLRENRIQCL